MYRNISGNKVVLVPHHIAESEDGDAYSVTVIVNKAFYAKTHGQDVEVFVLPDTVVSIGKYAFMLVNAKAIYMTDSVTTIGAEAFNSITTLETLVLSKNVATLTQNTFMGTSISNLFFTGGSNEMTTNVTRELTGKCGKIYYYSESSASNCWHYHNGAITIW